MYKVKQLNPISDAVYKYLDKEKYEYAARPLNREFEENWSNEMDYDG